jgi:AcrR family transcriptional regulator
VRRIAAAAGCSTMGLYSRFGGKDGVVDELYAEGFERLIDAMKTNQPTDDPLADLRRGAGCYRDTALANATHYMVMFGGAVPGFVPSESSHDLAHRAFDGFVAKVATCTDAGVLDGSADRIAELLWGAIHGLVMLEIVGINPLMSDPVPRFERALDVLFRGLAHG